MIDGGVWFTGDFLQSYTTLEVSMQACISHRSDLKFLHVCKLAKHVRGSDIKRLPVPPPIGETH